MCICGWRSRPSRVAGGQRRAFGARPGAAPLPGCRIPPLLLEDGQPGTCARASIVPIAVWHGRQWIRRERRFGEG